MVKDMLWFLAVIAGKALLPLKVFDVIEAFHASGHLFSQFFNVRLSSHCLFSS